MRYVLDASIAVAAVRPSEPAYAAARKRIASVLAGTDEIVVPAIFTIEVAASLARAGWPMAEIEGYLATLAARTVESATIGVRRVPRIRGIAVRARLRAADAVYVWLAAARGLALVTLDREVAARAATLCAIEPP